MNETIRKNPLLLAVSLVALLLHTAPLAAEETNRGSAEVQVGAAGEITASDEANWCINEGAALRMIREERDLLENQRRLLKEEESRIEVARARLEGDIKTLVELKDEVSSILARAEAKYSEDVESLVQLYSSMRDKQAAAIFEQMDLRSVVEIVAELPERVAGPILARMDPAKAQAITRVILDRNRLPADRLHPDIHVR